MGTHFKGKANEVRALDTFIKLMRASRSIHQLLEKQLAEHQLTENQLGLLEILLHLGPQCQRSLGQKLLTSAANVTLVVDQLEKRNLVKRERSADDRRFLSVSLTAEGRRFIEKVFPAHAASITEAFGPLTAAEQESLGELCKRLGLETEQLLGSSDPSDP